MHSVLFVCTMNICRSPMAMGLLQKLVSQEAGEWRIESAGVLATPGYPAAMNVMAILREQGIDLTNHRSRRISSEMVNGFQLILAMERSHKEALRAAFPQKAARIFLVSEMIGQKRDIVDPTAGTWADYLETAGELQAILGQGLVRIRQASDEQAIENAS